MQIDLYVNKKFDVIKIIKLVLKRKDWGKTYTLYKTTTHEVLTQMRSYNFTDKYVQRRVVADLEYAELCQDNNFLIRLQSRKMQKKSRGK